jgi:hypothetical protein
MKTERPKFLPSFFHLLSDEIERSGIFALIPYAFIVSVGIGTGVAFLIPKTFWGEAGWAVSTVVYTGVLTLNGLILALGWNAFGRVYDTLFRGEFAAYMAEKELLNPYLVHIGVMHWAQVAAVLASGVALVAVLIAETPAWAQRALFGLTVATTVYAIKQAVSAISMMNDLVWQAGVFEALSRRAQQGSPLSTVRGGKS